MHPPHCYVGNAALMSSTDDEGRAGRQYDEANVDVVGADDATDGKSSDGSRHADWNTTDTPREFLDHDTEPRVESRDLLRVLSSISVSITSPGVRLVCKALTTNLGRQLITGMSKRHNQNWAVDMACCMTQYGFWRVGES